MRKAKITVLLLLMAAFAGCATSEVEQKTRALNRRQLEALQRQHALQLKIQNFVEGFEAVARADVHFLEDGIRIGLYFKPGMFLSFGEKEKINEFVIKETGLPRDKIRLPLIRR